MASTRLIELKYRTFDELMTEVYIDLPSFAREGLIEPGQLIKVAQKINYELGLKIHKTKETMLDIEHGHAKLPNDFHILNLGILCSGHTVHERGLFDHLHTEDVPIPLPAPNMTTCPCWQLNNTSTDTISINYVDGYGRAASENVFPGLNRLCALSIQTQDERISASTDSFCFASSGILTCDPPACTASIPIPPSNTEKYEPFHQSKVYTLCNNTMEVMVIEEHSTYVREYRRLEMLHIKSSKEATDFCINTQFRNTRHEGYIRNGFIYIPTLHHDNRPLGYTERDTDFPDRHEERLYICYLGAMEDDNGNLLVLDHPKINNYYEWALKEWALSTIYLNGEPDMERRLQLAQEKLKEARNAAYSIVNTPDFHDLKRVIEENRKATYAKYMHPFSKLYGNTPHWPWSINSEHI